MKTTENLRNICPSCGTLNDCISDVLGQNVPEEGDISICLCCGHLMAFTADLSTRELTSEEMYTVAGDKRILAIQRARQVTKGKPDA